MTPSPITIILADDHRILRETLRASLAAQPDFQIVAEAEDGLAAAELTEQLKPAVLVLDLIMPGLAGLDVLQRVAKRSPRTRVVVLTMHATESHLIAALKHGACGYVVKSAGAEELAAAIRSAAVGKRFLSAQFTGDSADSYLRRAEGSSLDPYETLTGREREVLQLAAEGRSSAQIAERLRISPRTAETHRANALKKLNLHGQTHLVLYAVEKGFLANPVLEPLDARES